MLPTQGPVALLTRTLTSLPSLSQPLSYLSGKTNTLPVDNDTLSALFDSDADVVEARAETVATILTTQSAPSTLKQYLPHFIRWQRFCNQKNINSMPDHGPPSYADDRKRTAVFNAFVVDEYIRNKNRGLHLGRTGRAAANKPGTYEQIFKGINHIIEKVFGRRPIGSTFLVQAIASYKRLFASPTKKAKPLLGKHLRTLCHFAAREGIPWISVVARVAVIMWSNAGRWSCVNRIDIRRTLGHKAEGSIPENPDPSGRYSFTYWWGRKNRHELTATTCPTVDDELLDSRKSFLWLLNEFSRIIPSKPEDDFGIIPELVPSKTHGFKVNLDPRRRCSYKNMLAAFRLAMKRAGLQEEIPKLGAPTSTEWSLHAGRRGFVVEARSLSNGVPLLYEVLSLHGAWSMQSLECMMGYNDCNPADHAATISELMHSSLSLKRKSR